MKRKLPLYDDKTKELLIEALDMCNGCRKDAAKYLNVSVSTLHRRLRDLKLLDYMKPEKEDLSPW